MRIYFGSLLIFQLLVGCVHSTIVPFQMPGEAKKNYPPTDPQSIAIYRTEHPFASFVELGMITYRAERYNLASMYDQIRKDASEYGAQAVIDVKVTNETHSEFVPEENCVPVTSCDINGACDTKNECHTDQVSKNVTTFLITGSMIRKKP